MVSGLAASVTLGFVCGIGGMVSGLAASVTLGFVCGIGGMVSGLANAYVATVDNATVKTRPRTETNLGVITMCSFAEKLLRIQRVTQKGYTRYNKSDIAQTFFKRWVCFLRPLSRIWLNLGYKFALYSPLGGSDCSLFA
jgi:hypothetical protein